MSTTNPTGRHTIEASPTTVHLAEPGTAAPPKAAKRHRLKRMITGLALAAAATGAVAAVPGGIKAASAQPLNFALTPQSSFYLMLDVSGASQAPYAPVIQWWSNGGANQFWYMQYMSNGTKEIVNLNSNQCLTTDGVAGDNVYQFPCEGLLGQEWYTDFPPGGSLTNSYPFESALSGLFLDVNGDSPWPGAGIDTWYSNGGWNQYFGWAGGGGGD